YHRNFGKRLIKAPKLYFIDCGLATYLLGLHDPSVLRLSPFWGPVFETLVIIEFLKRARNAGELPALSYWRSSDGIEVDLIQERMGELHAYEIKGSETLHPSFKDSLRKWLSLSKQPPERARVLAPI